MKKLIFSFIAIGLVGCAHGKMGVVEKPLQAGTINKQTPLLIELVKTDKMQVTGDKADDANRINDEKIQIASRYNRMIADALRKKGYNAKAVQETQTSGVVLSGNVTRFEHGSGAARFLVGMGAGSSNLFTDFTLEDRSAKKLLSKFEVIATSGGRSGIQSLGGFLEAHLTDGADKASSYINGEEK